MDYYETGQIVLFPYTRIPQGWLPCNGQRLNVQEHKTLFKLIGNKFGGDGVGTFALPDLKEAAVLFPGMGYYICTNTL
jgi:microcystin-dependent protein